MSEVLVQVRGLVRRFGPVPALNGMDMTIAAGAPAGLVGPNGAGKTTLFSVLCGFLPANAGQVLVMGKPPGHGALQGRVSILPQGAALRSGVPIREQFALFARLQGFTSRDARAETQRVLARVAADDLARRAPDNLSQGQLKRVLIAQALIGDPQLVLLDEPTSGLDPESAENVRTLIRERADRQTFFVSSHNLDEIEHLCTSVVILDQGRVKAHGPIADFVDRAGCLVFRLERDPPADIEAILAPIDGIVRIEIGQPGEHRLSIFHDPTQTEQVQIQTIRTLSSAGIAFLEMSRGESLSKRFVEMTRRNGPAPTANGATHD